MNVKKLDGINIKADALVIINDFEQDITDTVYVFTGDMKLFAYIDELKDNGVDDSMMFKLKICYEKMGMRFTVVHEKTRQEEKVNSVREIIERLDGSRCSIIVEDNNRNTLADTVQQLIYIGYPLTTVDIMLRKEAKDAKKTQRFRARIDELSDAVNTSLASLENLYMQWENEADISNDEKEKNLKTISDAQEKCRIIDQKIKKANVEMSISVIASKKTGKSVIINGMIGEELAPTSLTLATPNNCIYKVSPDNMYHLEYNGRKTDYAAAGELHKVIGKEFNAAQEKEESGLAIPDMTIEYVVDKGNNCDKFTVWDTPGPDLAGAEGHKEKLREAVEKTDVAIFAIDYSKYLTEGEVDLLKKIKDYFNSNQKYASLIFALNKLDLRFQNADAVKSVVYAIDLIRYKLAQISERYKDCIIFATSALQYYNTIDCERFCGDEFSKAKNLCDGIRELIKKQTNSIIRNEMSYLRNIINSYEDQLNFDKLTAEDLKQYSGMPDLLDYAAYICRSKARDEIINNITVTIDSQTKALKSICDRIANIDKLINEDQDKIEEIRAIIDNYSNTVHNVLTETIYSDELKDIEYPYESIYYFMNDSGSDNITMVDMEGIVRDRISEMCPSETDTYNYIFQSMESSSQDKLNAKIAYYKNEGLIDESNISKITDAVFSKESVSKCAVDCINDIVERMKDETHPHVEGLRNDMTALVKMRIGKINTASENCRNELQKLEIALNIPEMPNFTFEMPEFESLEDLDVGDIKLDVETSYIHDLFVGDKISEFRQFFRNIVYHKWDFDHHEHYVKSFDEASYHKAFKTLHKDIEDMLADAKTHETLVNESRRLSDTLEELTENIRESFTQMLEALKTNVNSFTGLVDDTEKHKQNIEAHNREKAVINEVSSCFGKFTDIWEKVLADVENKKELSYIE